MTEHLWPVNIIPSSQQWGNVGNVGAFSSPLSGVTRTISRQGSRMRCVMTVPPVKGRDRARMISVLSAARDRSNAIWIPDFSTTRNGSFPATEALTNNYFSNSTTGWSATTSTLTVSDLVARLTNTKASGAAGFLMSQTPSYTQYAPYCARTMVSALSRDTLSVAIYDALSTNLSPRSTPGMMSAVYVPSSASGVLGPLNCDYITGQETVAGDYAESSFTSVTRCAMVDGGASLFTRGDAIDNAAWTKVSATVTADIAVSPDGTTTAERIAAPAASSLHYVSQGITVSSAAVDVCVCVALKANGYNYASIDISNGATDSYQVFNIVSGSVGASGATTANWSNRRAFISALGNGWFLCCMVIRKTNSSTALTVACVTSNTDAQTSFTGDGSSGMLIWRATAAMSSVPVRLVQTTSAAVAASTQNSNRLHLKGLPVSTNGLLNAGDMVQIGSQINIVNGPLNSNAAGTGILTCSNTWRAATADAAVIIDTPMSKMMLADDGVDWDTVAGQFSSFTIELVEVVE